MRYNLCNEEIFKKEFTKKKELKYLDIKLSPLLKEVKKGVKR